MCRNDKMIEYAMKQALKSNLKFQHGAILSKGGKILASGFNKSRSSFMNITQTCLHAEMDVINKYYNTVVHKKLNLKKKQNISELSKCILWVIRLSANNELVSSKPCNVCINNIKKIGVKKIGYSDENGNIIIENTKDISNNHISEAQKKYNP